LPKLTGIFLSHSQSSSPPRSQPSSKQFLSDAMPASSCIRPAPRTHIPPVRLRLRTLTHESIEVTRKVGHFCSRHTITRFASGRSMIGAYGDTSRSISQTRKPQLGASHSACPGAPH
jgi:hypothetical protein